MSTTNMVTTVTESQATLPMAMRGDIVRPTEPDADAINREHERARRHANDAIKHAIRCGELLLAKKAELPHGEFTYWIRCNCKFKQATANNYMRLARNPSAVGNSLRHLYESGRRGRASVPTTVTAARKAQPMVAAITTDNAADDHHHVVVSPDDRTAMLAAIKVAITTFADRYGWNAAAIDVGAWIEAQAEARDAA